MRFGFKSFYWCLGTTSFRTKNFNKRIEQQLSLLRDFWAIKENAKREWNEQNGVQTAYYDFLHASGFIYGDAKNKPKDAREKTSGLAALGLIDDNRRLTEVGQALLTISEQNNFDINNILGLPADSFIYFKQLLKTSIKFDGENLRPFIVTVYLISKLNGLSYEEYKYLLPLAIDRRSTEYIFESIQSFRGNKISIDDIIFNRLISRENYQAALNHFLNVPVVTEEVIMDIGMNRKSRTYDKAYYPLYVALRNFYVNHNEKAIIEVLNAINHITNTKTLWKQYLFDTASQNAIIKEPYKHLLTSNFDNVHNEEEFRRSFFATMHIIKVKRSLSDYFDLNRRYMKTADILLFEDDKVILDTIPKHYFASICNNLLEIAFKSSMSLNKNCELQEIAQFLQPDERVILAGINREFSLNLTSLQEADEILERQRYLRFSHLIDSKFTDDKLLKILDLITIRNDTEIQDMVTDNADIPTIFEYILGIVWYKISNRQGKILDYMKLSLDVDLLPKTHAAGGEADIVYEYEGCEAYPKHCLLLEATLADGTNQRRMEMEPVSRHLGNHILRNKNLNSYCVFVTNELNINVIADFRSRKYTPYYDTTNSYKFINGMKIIPLEIENLKAIIKSRSHYETIYKIFEEAFKCTMAPHKWYSHSIVSPLSEK